VFSDLVLAVAYAVVTILFGPTKISLLLCAIAGPIIRLRYDRKTTQFLAVVAVCLILLVDSVMIAIDVPTDPYIGSRHAPPYAVLLMPAVAWIIHLPLGVVAARLSLALSEFWLRRLGR
jgi:hypothetical protein